MNESISTTLGHFASTLEYDAIPAAVRECAQLHLIDTIGVACASASFDFARRALDGLRGFGTGNHAVIGMAARLEPSRQADARS